VKVDKKDMVKQFHKIKVLTFLMSLASPLALGFGSSPPALPNPPSEPSDPSPDPSPDPDGELRIYRFSLFDESTGEDVAPYENLSTSTSIDLNRVAAEHLNIRVQVEGDAESVSMRVDNSNLEIDNEAPFLIFPLGSKFLDGGIHTLSAEPFSEDNASGHRGVSRNVILRVFEKNTGTPPSNPPITPPTTPPTTPKPDPSKPPKEPAHNGEVNVTKTIVINKSGVYDFKNKLHIWKGQNWNCGADKENGPQILRIEADNVTVKNFHFVGDGKTKGSNGLGDPIHITSCGSGQGNKCPSRGPRNVVVDGLSGHACEDMITVGTPNGKDITIQNSYLKANPNKSNWDKTIQVNFGEAIKFYNNDFVGGKFCIRLKPSTSAEVVGNRFYGCRDGVKASANDADISPMKNGTVRVLMRDNKCFDCKNEISTSGDVKVER